MWRFQHPWRAGSLAAVSSSVVAALAVVWALRSEPGFYRAAATRPPADQQAACDECLARAAALTGAGRYYGSWRATFSADQINAWLAIDVARNWSDYLPAGFRDPRVAVDEQGATIACRYGQGWTSCVCSWRVGVEPLGENRVALRIGAAHAGRLPLPRATLLRAVATAAETQGWPLVWRQSGGDPVAEIKVPDATRHGATRRIDSVRLEQGGLVIVGYTEPLGPDNGPVVPPQVAAEAGEKVNRQR